MLAEQSKAATAQVRTILGDMQRATNAAVMATEQGTKGVDAGSAQIEQTGRTIGDLAGVVQQASQSAAQIAASIRQHAVGMEQIAAAMTDINQATQQGVSATADTQQAAPAPRRPRRAARRAGGPLPARVGTPGRGEAGRRVRATPRADADRLASRWRGR